MLPAAGPTQPVSYRWQYRVIGIWELKILELLDGWIIGWKRQAGSGEGWN